MFSFVQIFSFMHPFQFPFLLRLWRFWKLQEKYRCGFAFSRTVSLASWLSHVFGMYIWCDDCMTSPAGFSLQTTKDRRRGPSIRWRQRKGVDWCVILFLPRPAVSSSCLCFNMTNVWLTDSPRLLHTYSLASYTPTQNASWSAELSSFPPGCFQRSGNSPEMEIGKLWKWKIFYHHA